eukprot:snap_masked-scaffold_11-processed-gene-2.10-mRNA-1 protein AED:1.00 eAED:1.00 QI:0/-1/0/0/-1/1/1/0/409
MISQGVSKMRRRLSKVNLRAQKEPPTKPNKDETAPGWKNAESRRKLAQAEPPTPINIEDRTFLKRKKFGFNFFTQKKSKSISQKQRQKSSLNTSSQQEDYRKHLYSSSRNPRFGKKGNGVPRRPSATNKSKKAQTSVNRTRNRPRKTQNSYKYSLPPQDLKLTSGKCSHLSISGYDKSCQPEKYLYLACEGTIINIHEPSIRVSREIVASEHNETNIESFHKIELKNGFIFFTSPEGEEENEADEQLENISINNILAIKYIDPESNNFSIEFNSLGHGHKNYVFSLKNFEYVHVFLLFLFGEIINHTSKINEVVEETLSNPNRNLSVDYNHIPCLLKRRVTLLETCLFSELLEYKQAKKDLVSFLSYHGAQEDLMHWEDHFSTQEVFFKEDHDNKGLKLLKEEFCNMFS